MSLGLSVEVIDDAQWARHVADLWVERLNANPRLRMCLATGATPVPVYEEMARRVAVGEVSFAGATIFVLDEWLGLPPGHEVRCDSMLDRDLVRHIDVPPSHVHTFDVDTVEPDELCRQFDDLITSGGGLDLAVLGLGRNGHLGMNEPGSPFDSRTRKVPLAEATRQGAANYGQLSTLPTEGVTVGLGTLAEAAEIWLLVTGETKSAILTEVVNGDVNPDLPATSLKQHKRALLFADTAAASQIGQR